MKKLKLTKVIAGTLVIASVLALNPIGASAEWKKDNRGWWYTEGNSWAVGWRVIDGSLYYFKQDGYMIDNTNNLFLKKEYGLNSNGQFTNVTIDGTWAFYKPTGELVAYVGSDSNVVIPDKINDVAITSIGTSAFICCNNLRNITIPSSVTNIGEEAFADCNKLANITIPNSVTRIGTDAFINCINLTSVAIPDSVTWIGYGAFRNCRSLTSITIPNSVTSIHEFEFQGCISLTSINIPNSVTNIEGEAFYGCGNLTSITISDSVTKIGDNAFTNPFTGCTNATIYVKNEAMKQLLINSGVSASKIIVSA